MKHWALTVSKLPADAMALYPFMLFRNKALRSSATIINHESIHFRQQQELLILPFYLLYVLHYLLNRVKYRNHRKAYLAICFEREAYAHDSDFSYLSNRKPYAWLATFKAAPDIKKARALSNNKEGGREADQLRQ